MACLCVQSALTPSPPARAPTRLVCQKIDHWPPLLTAGLVQRGEAPPVFGPNVRARVDQGLHGREGAFRGGDVEGCPASEGVGER